MQAYANYTINLLGTQEDTAAAADILAEAFKDKALCGQTTMNIEGTREVVWINQAIGIAKKIAREVPALQKMEITGYTDSEGDGTMMDFVIKYEDQKLVQQSTPWYSFFMPFGLRYHHFRKEFCDENGKPLYSRKDFKKFTAGDRPYFLVKNAYWDSIIVEDPGFSEPKEVDPNSEDF